MNNNVTLNKKGCEAFATTTNYCCDFFTLNSKELPKSLSSFTDIVERLLLAKNENIELFVKIIKYHRLIDNGNGIKWLYYLSMILLKLDDITSYESILKWSWEYPKDFHNLHRMHYYLGSGQKKKDEVVKWKKQINKRIYVRSKIPLSIEMKIYGDLIFSMFLDLLQGKDSKRYNPMLIKYLSFENGLWRYETSMIWNYLESLFQSHSNISKFITMADNKGCDDISSKFRSILYLQITYSRYNQRNTVFFTNRIRRKIKVLFNEYINITDNLFKGLHTDNTKFGSHSNEPLEITMIYDVIRKTPSISNQLFTKKMKRIQQLSKFQNENQDIIENQASHRTLRDNYLVKGYLKYIESIKTKVITAKSRGVDLSQECFQYYVTSEYEINDKDYDYNLDSKLNDMIDSLRKYLLPCFNETFTYDNFSKNVVLLLDNSGSMDGTPLETGLLYILMMIKIFRVKTFYLFNSDTSTVNLTNEDIDDKILNLLKKVYVNVRGSTNLQSAFTLFERLELTNKKVIIISDGDCDEDIDGKSPFRDITKLNGKYKFINLNSYVVVNVNSEMMSFPYLSTDANVCYVSGNNAKTLRGFIKSVIVSIEKNIVLTPFLILQSTIGTDELILPIPLNQKPYEPLNSSDILLLYDSFLKNGHTHTYTDNYDNDGDGDGNVGSEQNDDDDGSQQNDDDDGSQQNDYDDDGKKNDDDGKKDDGDGDDDGKKDDGDGDDGKKNDDNSLYDSHKDCETYYKVTYQKIMNYKQQQHQHTEEAIQNSKKEVLQLQELREKEYNENVYVVLQNNNS